MTTRYSKTTGSFYPLDIDYGANLPADAVEITKADHAALLEGQSAGKRIVADASGKPVLADPPKATASEVWERIKAEREHRKAGGYQVGTKWFHSDADSRIQQLGLKDKARDMMAAGGAMTASIVMIGQPVKWKTMDGSFVQATAQLAFDIVAAAGELDERVFVAAETHKAAMEASADPSAYDFSMGWPVVFAG